MNNKKELQKTADELKEKLKDLEKQIAALPDENDGKAAKWVPKIGDEYWFLDSCLETPYTATQQNRQQSRRARSRILSGVRWGIYLTRLMGDGCRLCYT